MYLPQQFLSIFKSIVSIASVLSFVLSIDTLVLLYCVISVISSLVLTFIKNKLKFNYTEEKVANDRKVGYFKSLFFNFAPAKDIKLSNSYDFCFTKFLLILAPFRHINIISLIYQYLKIHQIIWWFSHTKKIVHYCTILFVFVFKLNFNWCSFKVKCSAQVIFNVTDIWVFN